MKKLSVFAVTSCLVFFGLFAAIAKADVSNKKTIITINAPVKVPGYRTTVLPAGKYVLKVLDSTASRNIVLIYNEDENKLLTTVLAIPNYRLEPSDKSEFTFWETPSGEPVALRSWFYPGEAYGFEFAYPRKTAAQVASASHKNIPTVYAETEEAGQLKEARVGATTPEGSEARLSSDYSAPSRRLTLRRVRHAQALRCGDAVACRGSRCRGRNGTARLRPKPLPDRDQRRSGRAGCGGV